MFNGIIFNNGYIKKISKKNKGIDIFIKSKLNLKKKVSYKNKKFEKISIINFKLIHQIFDTINISLLVLISTLFIDPKNVFFFNKK